MILTNTSGRPASAPLAQKVSTMQSDSGEPRTGGPPTGVMFTWNSKPGISGVVENPSPGLTSAPRKGAARSNEVKKFPSSSSLSTLQPSSTFGPQAPKSWPTTCPLPSISGAPELPP